MSVIGGEGNGDGDVDVDVEEDDIDDDDLLEFGVFEDSLQSAINQLNDPSSTSVLVDLQDVEDDGAGDDEGGVVGWRHFPAFVEALGRHVRVESLTFRNSFFGDDDDDDDGGARRRGRGAAPPIMRPEDLERLFGAVLPLHLSLTTVAFESCSVDPKYLRLLLPVPVPPSLRTRSPDGPNAVDRLQRRPSQPQPPPQPPGPRQLRFVTTALDSGPALEALAKALRHGILDSLHVVQCSMDSASCKLLVQAAAADNDNGDDGNCSVRSLLLVDNSSASAVTVDESTFAGDAIGRLRARELSLLVAGWTIAGIADLLCQLRTNERLEHLTANVRRDDADGGDGDEQGNDPAGRQLDEPLGTYNFTLRGTYLTGEGQARVDAMLRRNGRARRIHQHLQSCNSCVEDRALWPHALAAVSRFPTLLQRLVRRGDIIGLADQLMLRSVRVPK